MTSSPLPIQMLDPGFGWDPEEEEDEMDMSDGICMFRSNVPSLRGGNAQRHSTLLLASSSVQHQSSRRWFVHWENCGLLRRKAMRKLYHKPAFFPPALELTPPNWIIASSNYNASRFKFVSISTPP